MLLFLDNQTRSILDYIDFLNIPEVKVKFSIMYDEQKSHFRDLYKTSGFDKEHLDLISMKTALISTDMYFTSLHKDCQISTVIKKAG